MSNTIHTPPDECESSFFPKEEVLNTLKKNKPDIPEKQSSEPENIILFIIENFSLKYVKADKMPFLTDLSQRGLFFKNHVTIFRERK